jgi:hypothetical protein
LQTVLLKDAAAAGAITVSGLEMFVGQVTSLYIENLMNVHTGALHTSLDHNPTGDLFIHQEQ